ncbi:hypothetical protein VTI74DRAFT_9238 [Chaetomium olivicolor]
MQFHQLLSLYVSTPDSFDHLTMPFTVRIREIDRIRPVGQLPEGISPAEWSAEISVGNEVAIIRLTDPFSASPELVPLEPEKTVSWYLEHYINEPFEVTKAEIGTKLIPNYGRLLASQIARSGLLPKYGDVRLLVLTPTRTGKYPDYQGQLLQHLHWEVLGDASLWPADFRFSSVSVVRSLIGTEAATGGDQENMDRRKRFNILLVVSRPRPDKDVEYQLVAKFLVAIVGHVSKTKPDVQVSLKIVRPPTWQAFREHLRDYHYDLVHFDTKGEIQTTSHGVSTTVLEFCKPDLSDPLKMKRDMRTAEEVGRELAGAGVRTVILNACNSASFRDATPGSNLAEVLLGHGVQSVLAMAYKVVEEAVEIFMTSFYYTLLAEGAPVQTATQVARSALLDNRSRRARYMQTIELSDYIVPVLYTAGLEEENPSSSISASVKRILKTMKQLPSKRWITGQPKTAVAEGLFGRDYNILSLEILLSVTRLVFLYGQGGIGKTELLRYACEWWKSSGWISAAVYIDLADRSQRYFSMHDILEHIGRQIGLERDKTSESEVIRKLRSGKYLVVFDSAEVFDTSVYLDRITCLEQLPGQLKAFVTAVNGNDTMVIIASRLNTTSIAHIPSEHHKYHLPGLSVLDSVRLLQELSFGGEHEIPKILYRGENIDYLRRAVILLEGNPAAIQLIVPELTQLNYNGESLFEKLLYGVCDSYLNQDPFTRPRFVQSLSMTLLLPSFIDFDNTLISATQFAPFWTLLPQDLTAYYHFLYLPSTRTSEGTFADWLSSSFLAALSFSTMSSKLTTHWPSISTKFFAAGILLSEATITRKTTPTPLQVYHLHPLYTLLARAMLTPTAWQRTRFAYIRHTFLWDSDFVTRKTIEWSSLRWDGDATLQHDDHLHNWRFPALHWALQDGDPFAETERMGVTLFDCAYRLVLTLPWDNPRQARLLVPLLRSYLLQAHMVVDLFRPGGIPTEADLWGVVSGSKTLCKLEREIMEGGAGARRAVVEAALGVVEKWREGEREKGRDGVLKPHVEVDYHQLLHAVAAVAEDEGDLQTAKGLYERCLAVDPVATDATMMGMFRRGHLQSLQAWSACVVRLAVRGGTVDTKRIQEMLGGVAKYFGHRPGSMLGGFVKLVEEHPDEIAALRVRDQMGFALEREAEAVKGFGRLAKEMLEAPLFSAFEDILDEEVHDRATSGKAEAEGEAKWQEDTRPKETEMKVDKETKLKMILEHLAKMLGSVDQKRRKDSGLDAEKEHIRAAIRNLESGLRMFAGDNIGAAETMRAEMAREALSSTTGMGWQRLADLHMYLYTLAVSRTERPDYRKGLAHLNEWWKLHQGVGVSKRDRCYGLMNFATCYHELDQVADAARSVIKLIKVGQTLGPEDCIGGDVSAAHHWLYGSIVKLDKLHVFLDPRVIFSKTHGVVELCLAERVMMYQIMTRAKEDERETLEIEEAIRQSRQTMKQLRNTLQKYDRWDADAQTKALIEEVDQVLEQPQRRDTNWWLF